MEFYIPPTQKELSQRKIEVYSDLSKILRWGRRCPIKFAEHFYGLALMDYQKIAMMGSWAVPYALWLECRGAGKDTLAAVYFQTKMLLIPNYVVYVSSNTSAQSAESFMKLEDIALQRIPSFKSATDIFAYEVEKSANSSTGFLHNPAGYKFRLYNNSRMETLSSNIEGIRGKRGGVWFNETAWLGNEALAVVENFANVDASFSTSTEQSRKIDPPQMPLQILYTSSAGDVSFPFFEKYKAFAKKMFIGDRNYFCIDIDAYDILHHSSLNGIPIKSHLSEEQIKKAIDEDPDAADRELFNKFRKGSGKDAVVSMDTLIRNSVVRKPELYNITGKDKYIFCYDPARNYDGSILAIFKVIEDKEIGYKLELVNVISMVDNKTKNKTPLPMPAQLDIIKDCMIRYNGERAAEWENIELWLDSGAGGGGISAIADQLMEDWTDSTGQKHRGIIDPIHKQYETARKKYTHAMPIVHLIDPQGYKKIIYDALAKMTKLDLISFTSYDNKDYILIEKDNGELEQYNLSDEERLSLLNIELTKTEVSYMCRYDTANGGISYELAKDKRNSMHDDRAYVTALGAYALSILRRHDLVTKPKQVTPTADFFTFKAPQLYKYGKK